MRATDRRRRYSTGSARWADLCYADQHRINGNRHAFGLPPRALTAEPEVVLSPEQEEAERVLTGLSF